MYIIVIMRTYYKYEILQVCSQKIDRIFHLYYISLNMYTVHFLLRSHKRGKTVILDDATIIIII